MSSTGRLVFIGGFELVIYRVFTRESENQTYGVTTAHVTEKLILVICPETLRIIGLRYIPKGKPIERLGRKALSPRIPRIVALPRRPNSSAFWSGEI